MDIEFDSAKNERNITQRGISFELAHSLDWNRSIVAKDIRHDYEETRFQALGPINGRLYMMVFTIRGDALRIISLRKANSREVSRYEKAKP